MFFPGNLWAKKCTDWGPKTALDPAGPRGRQVGAPHTKFDDSEAFLEIFRGSEGPKIARKSLSESPNTLQIFAKLLPFPIIPQIATQQSSIATLHAPAQLRLMESTI